MMKTRITVDDNSSLITVVFFFKLNNSAKQKASTFKQPQIFVVSGLFDYFHVQYVSGFEVLLILFFGYFLKNSSTYLLCEKEAFVHRPESSPSLN